MAEDTRIFDLLITQATLANDADGYAQAHYDRVRHGTPFALTAGIGLARKCTSIAPTPHLTAMAQNDLAIALQEQSTRTAGPEGADLLAEAVESYRAALCVFTDADHPVDWAMIQGNLANVEKARAAHDSAPDPRPHLEAALAHVQNALRVYDPAHMSYDHGSATQLRNNIQAALDALSSSSS
ncbi:hypothetical protein [uncultured Tateyamaria sp.]|uniref:hypothetical protein n=1 Tax=Tateyamaria sp. 1078 TaxID=3417464 RepID=UPI00261772E9|nr:hypothetical protein [uncultured Tateyamaria sp.]